MHATLYSITLSNHIQYILFRWSGQMISNQSYLQLVSKYHWSRHFLLTRNCVEKMCELIAIPCYVINVTTPLTHWFACLQVYAMYFDSKNTMKLYFVRSPLIQSTAFFGSYSRRQLWPLSRVGTDYIFFALSRYCKIRVIGQRAGGTFAASKWTIDLENFPVSFAGRRHAAVQQADVVLLKRSLLSSSE